MSLTVLPGGRRPGALVPGHGHVTVRRPVPAASATERVAVTVTLLDLSLIVAVLRATRTQSCMDLAAELPGRCFAHPSLQPADRDQCPPHGIPRPGGVA